MSVAVVDRETRSIRRMLRAGLGELWRDKAAFLSVVFLLLLVGAAIFAPLIAPHDPTHQSLVDRLRPPAWQGGGDWSTPLGTDGLGRDVLSRLIYGSRSSLVVGVAVVVLSAAVGVPLGLVAGYRGGRIDAVIMRAVDVQFAFPGLLIAITIIATVGASLTAVIIVLSLTGWMVFARVTRGAALSLSASAYVEAATIVGCRPRRIVFRHILPNIASPLLTLAVLEFAHQVLSEAALSYIGLGIQPPSMSWGLDIAIGQEYILNAWWLVTFPGIAIAATVLAANISASWLRVVLDPEQRDKASSPALAAEFDLAHSGEP
jgi:peptide/nickel transport system permease protein